MIFQAQQYGGFVLALTICKTMLGSPLHILMDIKAHLISISTQSQKSLHAEWMESQDGKVSSSWLLILMLG